MENEKIIVAKNHINIDQNPIYHTGQNYLKFINTSYFSVSTQHYLKHKCYTHAPSGTTEFLEFWDEEENRCKNGYTVGGVNITGEHYAYLNYGRILATVGEGKRQRKVETFPRFIDMDYYWYHELDKAEKAGEGMIVVKARRYSADRYCKHGGTPSEVPIGTRGTVIDSIFDTSIRVMFDTKMEWDVCQSELELEKVSNWRKRLE